MKDYYEVLEVHPKASGDIIKKAYQTLARRYHPDLSTLSEAESTRRMSELNEAYRVLSDPAKSEGSSLLRELAIRRRIRPGQDRVMPGIVCGRTAALPGWTAGARHCWHLLSCWPAC